MAGSGAAYHDDDPGGGMIADINVTPLVDITLVLLIIFMVTARLIAARGIQVESPKTRSGDEVKTTLELTIDRANVLYYNGEPVPDRGALRDTIARSVRGEPDMQAVIKADIAVPHGEVMKVIDLVKLAGVRRFALGSAPLDEEDRE
jgi:biopolymer transport protein ExbD